MKYKNYYKILGLKSSKVTDDDIKSAYRKLAKKYHPDINPGNLAAAENFKDVNEAYQVLADEDLKRKYDRKHFVYSFKDTVSIKNLKEKIDATGTSQFVEMFIGKQSVKINKKKNPNAPIPGENLESEINVTLIEAFNGSNKKISFKGKDDKMKTITVKIPSGIVDGGKIRIKGQGKPGKNGGTIGDLLIKVQIQKHKYLELDKSNLICDLPITPSEAALGTSLNIEGIDSKVNIAIKAGTESGEILRIQEKGYFDENRNRGDLIAKVRIVVPKKMSDEERELYEKLQKITSFMPRKD